MKKPVIFNARALITREIMRSRDAQFNRSFPSYFGPLFQIEVS